MGSFNLDTNFRRFEFVATNASLLIFALMVVVSIIAYRAYEEAAHSSVTFLMMVIIAVFSAPLAIWFAIGLFSKGGLAGFLPFAGIFLINSTLIVAFIKSKLE